VQEIQSDNTSGLDGTALIDQLLKKNIQTVEYYDRLTNGSNYILLQFSLSVHYI